ncbi:TetR/AcrR family transcriptional regulator C-terminal domain-containing protein [Sphingomonas sp. MMS24-J13]|uniref:TetR/AcrR family transcriptional regulator C-terminal domain-containing protein n=1 Tax=Sphingomonas sp. MMS24-J13 TaxID=3238686 RepID=UPI00384C78FB
MARRRTIDGPTLDLPRIVEAAWALVDREGVAALSTRALAAALDVQGPALYYHVRSKQELLSLMLEHVLGESIGMPPPDLAWPDWLRFVGRAQRNALLAHRDSALIASHAPPTPRLRDEVFPRIMAPLLAAGLADREASAAAGALAGLILGWVVYEQRPETRDFVLAFHDPDEAFEFALDALVRGIEAKARA